MDNTEFFCSSAQKHSNIAFYSWAFGAAIPAGDPINFIGIYPEQHLVSVVEKSNFTIHFLNTRDGTYQGGIDNPGLAVAPTGFYFNH